jgi:fatty-acyl-CoA synthase
MTFKHKKEDLVGTGYDPAATPDAIFFDDPHEQAFVPMDQALYRRIQDGKVRL